MWRLHREISTYYTIQVKRPTDRSDNGCVTVTRKRMDGERTEVNRCDREKERWAKEIRKKEGRPSLLKKRGKSGFNPKCGSLCACSFNNLGYREYTIQSNLDTNLRTIPRSLTRREAIP